jgi:hypothetical protein
MLSKFVVMFGLDLVMENKGSRNSPARRNFSVNSIVVLPGRVSVPARRPFKMVKLPAAGPMT